ncbi:MAG: hypothetical protein CXB60_00015 [Spiroplasma poulsonii]|nr:hypothetical protein [Spiroplasma poulsonii]
MAQNPQRIFGDIANQATQKEREAFDQWYLQTYQQKFSWEALFAWKEANKFGLTYKRKKILNITKVQEKMDKYLILMIIIKILNSRIWRWHCWIRYNFNFCS